LYPFEIELENLFKQGALELDFNKRKVIYDKYQQIVAEHNPLIYLYAPFNISAIRKKFKNIYPTKLGGLIYDRAQIYIEN
jgi:peptide/nickel transport system substrate-binding protein